MYLHESKNDISLHIIIKEDKIGFYQIIIRQITRCNSFSLISYNRGGMLCQDFTEEVRDHFGDHTGGRSEDRSEVLVVLLLVDY